MLKVLAKSYKVKFLWVPGHMGCEGMRMLIGVPLEEPECTIENEHLFPSAMQVDRDKSRVHS